jgi:NAD(P)-dependent dehydrogenase (short-subunit alcohol dehydrogenase family)
MPDLFRPATKAAIVNLTAGLAQSLADKGIRANSVAPGPVWTPLIPSTMPAEDIAKFGKQSPTQRPAQPAEIAPIYVLLASEEASFISGAAIPATGGRPVI